MFDLIIGGLIAGILAYFIVLGLKNTSFSLKRLANEYGDYIIGFFLGLSLYLIITVAEGYGIGFRTFLDSKNSSITDTSSLILNYKRENQTYSVTAKLLKDQIPLLTDRT
jgi:H+/Cl- antiporter ClcA